MSGQKMKVTKEDKRTVRKMGLDREECEAILKTSGKKSWAYRVAKEILDEMDEGKI